jgi:actin-like ATPase involved in cell morphogenesis
MYQAENVVSMGHELDHDHLTLAHIRSELDLLIGELTAERAKVESAISRVNAGIG